MKAISKFFTRIFATYLFEKMLAKDIEQYKIRMEYLEDLLIDASNPDIEVVKYDRFKTEVNTILYKRERMAKQREEIEKLRRVMQRGI